MKKLALVVAVLVAILWPTAAHAGEVIDHAVLVLQGTMADHVYVDPGADLKLSVSDAERIRRAINGAPIYVAVLPAAAADEVGGNANRLPSAIGQRLGNVTVGTVSGKSFRAGSSVLPRGQAADLATTSFNAHHAAGLAPVLLDFVDRVKSATPGRSASAGPRTTVAPPASGGHHWTLVIVLAVLFLLVVVGLGVWVIVDRRRRAQADRDARDRETYEEMQKFRKVQVAGKKADDYEAGQVHQAEPKPKDKVGGQDVRVEVYQAGSRWYPGGYYGGAFYYPGYYPGSFMEGMLWGSMLSGGFDRDVDVDVDRDDRGSDAGADAPADSGDWQAGADDSGGGGDFSSSDDVSSPASEPSYDSGGGSDWGGGGDSGGGFDSGGGGFDGGGGGGNF